MGMGDHEQSTSPGPRESELLREILREIREQKQSIRGLQVHVSELEAAVRDAKLNQERSRKEAMALFESFSNNMQQVVRREMEQGQVEVVAAAQAKLSRWHQGMDSQPQFRKFMLLPLEIRNMIWELATPSRLVSLFKLGSSRRNAGSIGFRTYYPPPATAQVCRESRVVATRTGALRAIEQAALDRPLRERDPGRIEWAWFDPARDGLHFALGGHPHGQHFETIQDLTQVATRVVVEPSSRSSFSNICQWVFDPRPFPIVRTVELVCSHYVIGRRSKMRLAIERSCGDISFPCTIDLDNPGIFASFLYRDSDGKVALNNGVLQYNHDDGPFVDSGTLCPNSETGEFETWEDFREHLTASWRVLQVRFTPWTGPNRRISEQSDRTRDGWDEQVDNLRPSIRKVMMISLAA